MTWLSRIQLACVLGAVQIAVASEAYQSVKDKELESTRALAEQGDGIAQNILGAMYADGRGVPQDYREAVKWFRKAAEQGYAVAQTALGLMYAEGHGVPQDYIQAHKWYNLAAAGGEAAAAKNRDLVARRMTAEQIAVAQRLASEWKPKSPSPR